MEFTGGVACGALDGGKKWVRERMELASEDSLQVALGAMRESDSCEPRHLVFIHFLHNDDHASDYSSKGTHSRKYG